jgi:hypothetical protein
VTAFVGYIGDETPYPYRRDIGGDEFGFEVPVELIERLDAAQKAHYAATEVIRRYIEDNDVPEVELDEVVQ